MTPESNKAESAGRSLSNPDESGPTASHASADTEGMAELRGNGEAKWTRRPLSDVERRHLNSLGLEIMRLRRLAGLSRAELAEAANLSPTSIAFIERGSRRTTAIRLERMAAVLSPAAPTDDAARRLALRLVEMAGPALAETSPKAERAERRKERRQRRERQIREEAAVMAERLWRERKARADEWRNF